MNNIPNIFLYNTPVGKKELLKPLAPNKVTLYVCGPTLYDDLHIGNARPIIVFDVLFRLLKNFYSEVIYVRNITDIDDKIINKSQILGINPPKLVEKLFDKYKNYLSLLNVLPVTYEPWATNHVNDMISMINLLLRKGYAYIKDSHVFFSTKKLKEYGSLSNRSESNTVLGLGNDSIVKDIKVNQKDFVLWKPSKANEPSWDAPFGKGRPGWHIECSAMSYKYLGEYFDIHGGGSDLLFPHHENERAQTMAAFDCLKTANIWIHNAFINTNNTKMSKSLGNIVTVTEILNEFQGEVLRLSILLTHYRHPINFSKDSLITAKSILDKMYNALRLVNLTSFNKKLKLKEVLELKQSFLNALSDDLNTPLAINEIQKIVTQINKTNNEDLKQELAILLLYCANLLGLLYTKPHEWFTQNAKINIKNIENLIQLRQQAKDQKNYALADSIRTNLLKQGIVLEDNKNITTWRKI